MGNASIRFQNWQVNCREKKRTENTLYYVAVVSPNFQTTLTQITFPTGWTYHEREKLAPPPPEETGGKESARKRLREAYVQEYKRKKEDWVAAQPPPLMEDEEDDEGKTEEEKQTAAAERVQQASRKRRREFKMHEEETPKPQKELDAADTICRPFFRLLYEDTSLDFDHALEQVVASSDRLMFYRYQRWRIVLYIIDHTVPLRMKYDDWYKGSGLPDLFRPERPFNPDVVAETTRFINDEDAKSIVRRAEYDENVANITITLAEALQEAYTDLYNLLRVFGPGKSAVDEEGEKIKSITRGHFVDLQIQNSQRQRHKRHQRQKEEEKETNPWDNKSVWFTMQHAAAEIQLRSHDTRTIVSPMLVFHLMCASVIEKIPFQNNLNVWFNQILPHIVEIDTNIREKFQDSTSPLAQPMEDVNFVLCLLSYLSRFQFTEDMLQFTSMFRKFNAQENERFNMRLTKNSIIPFIIAAAQSVDRNSIVWFRDFQLVIVNKLSPQHDFVSFKKPYCVEGRKEQNCQTVGYENVAFFKIGSIQNAAYLLHPELNQAMVNFSPNKKHERACEMADIKMQPSSTFPGGMYAPSLWQDLKYFLSELARDCDPNLIADIVSTTQGIPHQVIEKLLKAPSAFPEQEEEGAAESENGKKRNDAIRDIAKSYLYSQAQKPQEKRLDPYMGKGSFEVLCTIKANDTKNAIQVPSLEDALALLQIKEK